MELRINGDDRSGDLGRQLAEAASGRCACSYKTIVEREKPVVELTGSARKGKLADEHMRLVRTGLEVDPSRFDLPVGRGFLGMMKVRLRKFLWKLMSYQHNWMAFRQNAVNTQLYYLIEFERSENQRRIGELERRVKELEAKK
jgi:hypothetical protein